MINIDQLANREQIQAEIILRSFEKADYTPLIILGEVLDQQIEKGEIEVFTENGLKQYADVLNKAISEAENPKEIIEKAKRDISKLVKVRRQVTRGGKTFTQTVYVKRGEEAKKEKKKEGGKLSNRHLSEFLATNRWKTGKKFPHSKLSRDEKLKVINSKEYQDKYINYRKKYLEQLNGELKGLDARNLPNRGITKDTPEEEVKEMRKALLYWKKNEETQLKDIEENGFEQHVYNFASIIIENITKRKQATT